MEAVINKLEQFGIKYIVATSSKNKSEILTYPVENTLIVSNLPVDLELEYKLFDKKANGVVWLPCHSLEIEDVIETIINKGKWFNRLTLTKKISDLTNREDVIKESFGFTKREKQIFALIYSGHTNKEIAELKSISEATVKSHVKNILLKTNTKNRTSLLVYLSNLKSS